jgi:hypothetical protein
MHTEEEEPDGTAEGLTDNALQQSKHFQCRSATVLCGTVNSGASGAQGYAKNVILNAVRRNFAP